jgi:hypothetical protein
VCAVCAPTAALDGLLTSKCPVQTALLGPSTHGEWVVAAAAHVIRQRAPSAVTHDPQLDGAASARLASSRQGRGCSAAQRARCSTASARPGGAEWYTYSLWFGPPGQHPFLASTQRPITHFCTLALEPQAWQTFNLASLHLYKGLAPPRHQSPRKRQPQDRALNAQSLVDKSGEQGS